MKSYQLPAKKRSENGKKATKSLRRENLIPVNVYGLKAENMNLVVSEADVRNLIYTPEIYSVDIDVEGDKFTTVLKEIQFHPVTDKILHIDFLRVDKEHPIVMEVPIVLEGHAAGVKAGGKLVRELRKLKVKATYDQIPEILPVNVENLELGKTIQVGELHYEGLELVNSKNAVVAAVRLTRAARGAAAAAAKGK